MNIGSSLKVPGSMRPGAAMFLPETPARVSAPATRSQLAAGGRAEFPGPYLDVTLVERQARELRARALMGLVSRFVRWLMESAERARYRELERYLARSTDIYDLERRIRDLERGRQMMFGPYL